MSNPGTSKDSYINEEDEDLNFLSEESDIEVYEEDLENPEDERVYEDEQDKPSNLEQFDGWSTEPLQNYEKLVFQKAQEEPPTVKMNFREIFDLIFTVQILNDIVNYTNEELKRRKKDYGSKYRSDPFAKTDIDEIRALFGLWLHFGVCGFNKKSPKDLFCTNPDQCSLEAHMTFTRLRYNALTRCLKFDLKENRDKKNRLAAIDEIWTAITNRFKMLNEVPGENMCIDESLVSFFGRVIFKMFMPKKSGKFGIKLFNIVDSDSKYCYDSKIYAGKEDDKKTERLSEQVVIDLTEKLRGTNIKLSTDNFYTDLETAAFLKQHGIDTVGTIRPNRRHFPKKLKEANLKEGEYLTIYAVFMDVPMSLTRIRVKATRDVYLLSTFHIPVKMTSSGKLNVVEYYNHKKVGIDQLDEMEKDYGYKPVFKRWTLCVFMWLLNVSAVNCMVLYKKRNAAILEARRSRPMSTRSTPAPEEELIGELLDEDTFRKRFLLDLSQQLMNEQKKKRAETCNDPKYLKMKKFYESMKNLGQEEPHKEQHYCEKCKKSKYRIFFTCAGCNKTGCSDCIKKYDICDECRIEPTPKKMKIEEPRGIPTRSDPSRGQTSSGRCYRCTKVSTFPPCLGNVIQKGHRFCADHRSKRHQKYCETCMP